MLIIMLPCVLVVGGMSGACMHDCGVGRECSWSVYSGDFKDENGSIHAGHIPTHCVVEARAQQYINFSTLIANVCRS